MFSIDTAWHTIRSQEVLAIIVILFVVFIYILKMPQAISKFLPQPFLPQAGATELWISEDAQEM